MSIVLAAVDPAAHSSAYYAALSLFYGVIEGITEFVPISSTAHLRICEEFTKIDMKSEYWKMYSVVIQLGAILSVPLLFLDRIKRFIATFPGGEDGRRRWWNHPLSLVMLAFVVTAGPCYLAERQIGKNLENLWVMAIALLVGGVIMWLVDALFTRPKTLQMENMGAADAVWIGLVQILSAAFPGTSRSMSTIAAGQVFSMSRSAALDFSFFLAMPTMFAATAYKMLQAVAHRPRTPAEIAAYGAPPGQWLVLAIGFVVSFLVALVVNRWFIHWVRKHGFAPFAIYRIGLGIGLLIWLALSRAA